MIRVKISVQRALLVLVLITSLVAVVSVEYKKDTGTIDYKFIGWWNNFESPAFRIGQKNHY